MSLHLKWMDIDPFHLRFAGNYLWQNILPPLCRKCHWIQVWCDVLCVGMCLGYIDFFVHVSVREVDRKIMHICYLCYTFSCISKQSTSCHSSGMPSLRLFTLYCLTGFWNALISGSFPLKWTAQLELLISMVLRLAFAVYNIGFIWLWLIMTAVITMPESVKA